MLQFCLPYRTKKIIMTHLQSPWIIALHHRMYLIPKLLPVLSEVHHSKHNYNSSSTGIAASISNKLTYLSRRILVDILLFCEWLWNEAKCPYLSFIFPTKLFFMTPDYQICIKLHNCYLEWSRTKPNAYGEQLGEKKSMESVKFSLIKALSHVVKRYLSRLRVNSICLKVSDFVNKPDFSIRRG